MMQQNRFCGIVFKSQQFKSELPLGFRHVQGAYFVSSEYNNIFDGIKTDELEAWSSADHQDGIITLSRDRVGVRALYYIDTKDYFCFANTITKLKELSFIQLKASSSGVFNFLFHGKTSGMLEDVHELDPGAILKYDTATLTYNIEDKKREDYATLNIDADQAAIQTRNLLLETVRAVGSQDGRLGAFLSGGIDSSVIACAAKVNDLELPYITAMSGDQAMDEIAYAGSVIAHLGLREWHQVLAGNVEKELVSLHLAMELPTTSLGSYMQYEMMRFCNHHGITHVLDGTGADALFAGHNYYNAIFWNELRGKGEFRRFREETKHWYMDTNWIKYYVKNMILYYYVPRLSASSKLRFYLRKNELLSYLNLDFLHQVQGELAVKPSLNLKNLNAYLAQDFLGGSVAELLRFTDRIGKAFDVVSYPVFCMSPELYNHALRLPSEFKIEQGYTKSVLRKAFADLLPESVLKRKHKMGLVAPNNAWMKQHKDLLLSYLTDDLSEYFQVDEMRKHLSYAIDRAGTIENYKIFRFFSFAIWHKVMLT